MYCLSMIRKFTILLWGILWIDPMNFITSYYFYFYNIFFKMRLKLNISKITIQYINTTNKH